MLEAMDEQLTGRSAILARRTHDLEQHIALCKSLPSSTPLEAPSEDEEELRRMLAELEQERKHARIVILGTQHACQENGNIHNPKLQVRLDFLREQFDATIVMEEWSENRKPSFASTLSVPYSNIGTTSEGKYSTYPSDIRYPGYRGSLDDAPSHPEMAEYGPLEHQGNRERAMVANIRRSMEPHKVGILILGLAHLQSMAEKLRDAGYNVAAFTWLPPTPCRAL
jgi:hypothetical protein